MYVIALFWGSLAIEEISCMQLILSCFGLISLLAAAESSSDPAHGLLWICLNGFSKQTFGLGPATCVGLIHTCVVQ